MTFGQIGLNHLEILLRPFLFLHCLCLLSNPSWIHRLGTIMSASLVGADQRPDGHVDKPKKRVITAARQKQNRAAQRAYSMGSRSLAWGHG